MPSRSTPPGTIAAAIGLAIPIGMAGLGGLWSERSGVVNIGLEGMMILGTWGAGWAGTTYGPWWGLLAGVGARGHRRRWCTPIATSPSASTRSSPASRSTCSDSASPSTSRPWCGPVSRRSHRRSRRSRRSRCPGSRTAAASGSPSRAGSSSPTARASLRAITYDVPYTTFIAVALAADHVLPAVAHGVRTAAALLRRGALRGRVAGRQRLPAQVHRRDRLGLARRASAARSSPPCSPASTARGRRKDRASSASPR